MIAMIAVLILNPDCSISALCEVEQYLYFQYQEQGCAVLKVEVSQEVFDLVKKTMWELRQNCYVLSKQHAQVATPEGSLVLLCDLEQEVPILSLE